MELRERLRYYRQARGMEQKTLSQALGLSKNVISNWENGLSKPDIYMMPKVCELLGISLEQLYGVEPMEPVVSKEERSFLRDYRALSRDNRRIVKGTIRTMLEVQSEQKVPKLKVVQYFDRPLSAGIGDPSEIEGFSEPMYLYDLDEYRMADYVFRINGDSMEPEYSSGDLVLVERMSGDYRPREGEIGAFIVGNEMYIKEYRPDGLHSLNPNYDTIRFNGDETVYLIGPVLCKIDENAIASNRDVELYKLTRE